MGYMIPKWEIPNVTRMSALACRTFNTVMQHLGILHMPTFRLSVRRVKVRITCVFLSHSPVVSQDVHTWTIFAMCTSAPRPGSDLRDSSLATNIGETPIIRKALEDMDKSHRWPKDQDTICREVYHVLLPFDVLLLLVLT